MLFDCCKPQFFCYAFFRKLVALFVVVMFCGCNRGFNTALYDKTGFETGSSTKYRLYNGSTKIKAGPDYDHYYRQVNYTIPADQMPPQNYQVPVQQVPYNVPYQQQPAQYAPPTYYAQPQPAYVPQPQDNYYNNYQHYQRPPASRYYSNPYDIPASSHPHNYYDADEYYVPPARYQGVEPYQGLPNYNRP